MSTEKQLWTFLNPRMVPYGRMVRVVKISDDQNIYHCIYNVTAEAGNVGDNPFSDDPGIVPQITLLARYPNHIGRVPYFPAPVMSVPATPALVKGRSVVAGVVSLKTIQPPVPARLTAKS